MEGKQILLVLLVIGTAAAVKESYLKLQNGSSSRINKISVTVEDESDWAPTSGPQNNFQGFVIAERATFIQREYLDDSAKSNYFTMELTFGDNTVDTYSVNLRAAVGEGEIDFEHLEGKRAFKATVADNILTIAVADV